jgi:histidyl-tRNA synthetase
MERSKNSPRGTYDLLPEQSVRWAYVETVAKQILAEANFKEIRTPIFESTEIFARAAGETSDIVNKEMYTFQDRSDRWVTLRPEGTAGVVRAFLSNGLDRAPKPLKLWYLGPMFRYERSQTGRYRQFTQLGLEVFGAAGPEIEFEAINLAWSMFSKLGLDNLSLEVNSVGDTETRQKYSEVMRQFLEEHKSQICPDCQTRALSNPLRALDCKVPVDQALYASQAPKLSAYLNEESQKHHKKLCELLQRFEIPFVQNETLVRGLDYYTKTVFEIKTEDPKLGVQSTICAGGRYDDLVKQFGGPTTPAFGWALGMERLLLLLPEHKPTNLDFFVIYPSGKFQEAYKVVQKVREHGASASLEYNSERSEDKQFEAAKKARASFAVLLKDDNTLNLRKLEAKHDSEFKEGIYAMAEDTFWKALRNYLKTEAINS